MTPEEFEEKISWIESLLKKKKADVQLNKKILDPDNPKQKRQIDITIESENQFTLVECRLHSRPQNVKWIEELYGRRVSLNATSVIAVSASGFTEGAIKKAERFGIIIRDFKTLTEDEINGWATKSKVYLEYLHLFDTIFFVVLEESSIQTGEAFIHFLETPEGKQWPVDTIFKSLAKKLDRTERLGGGARIQLFTKNLLFKGSQVNEIILQSNYDLKRYQEELPVISIYGAPGQRKTPEVIIERQEKSNFEIYKNEKSFSCIIDMSVVKSKPGAIFKCILFDFGKPVTLYAIKVIGLDTSIYSLIPFSIETVKRESMLYRKLLSPI